jgi:hypothetical protein
LAGCTTGRPAGPGTPAPAARDTTLSDDAALTADARALAVRAGSYRLEQQRLLQAELELTRRCMAEHHLNYLTSSRTGDVDDWWRPDPQSRRSHGYGIRTTGASVGGEDPGDPAGRAPDAGETARYRRALVGDAGARATLRLASGREFTFGTGGCIADSRNRLYGDVFTAAQVSYAPQDAYRTLYPRIEEHPAMTAAMRQWTACMRQRGHGYPSMAAARRAVGEATGSPEVVSRLEIRIAVDDTECVLAAQIPATVDRVGGQLAGDLVARQRRELNATAALRMAALARAAAVSADGGRGLPGGRGMPVS